MIYKNTSKAGKRTKHCLTPRPPPNDVTNIVTLGLKYGLLLTLLVSADNITWYEESSEHGTYVLLDEDGVWKKILIFFPSPPNKIPLFVAKLISATCGENIGIMARVLLVLGQRDLIQRLACVNVLPPPHYTHKPMRLGWLIVQYKNGDCQQTVNRIWQTRICKIWLLFFLKKVLNI